MFTKQRVGWLGSLVILTVFASPSVAQIIYVRDAAGYVRPVVLPQQNVFSMGMQVQPVIGGDGTFARVNVTPFGVSMPDPSTTVFLTVPGPNLGIFDGGIPQPSFISQKPMVLGIQAGQQGLFGSTGFGGQSIWASSVNQFGFGPFMRGTQQSSMAMSAPFQFAGVWANNQNLAQQMQAIQMNAAMRQRAYQAALMRGRVR